jgi:hypothetical protein
MECKGVGKPVKVRYPKSCETVPAQPVDATLPALDCFLQRLCFLIDGSMLGTLPRRELILCGVLRSGSYCVRSAVPLGKPHKVFHLEEVLR